VGVERWTTWYAHLSYPLHSSSNQPRSSPASNLVANLDFPNLELLLPLESSEVRDIGESPVGSELLGHTEFVGTVIEGDNPQITQILADLSCGEVRYHLDLGHSYDIEPE
jgi:hypothetical protein